MIESIMVLNHLNDLLELPLRDPYSTGIAIRSIDGLGPGKAAINTSSFAMDDGALFSSARLGTRNIVLSLEFLEAPTIEDVRLLTYKHFPIKKPVTLIVNSATRSGVIDGYVESNEPNIFSNREGSVVSIICPRPYFTSWGTEVVSFSSLVPAFEFPMENTNPTVKTLEVGTIQMVFEKNLYYDGDADSGVLITINASGPSGNITIHNTSTLESMMIDTTKLAAVKGSALAAGDIIYISTVKGDKFARLLSGGVYKNIINCLGMNVNWLQLSRGDNLFSYTTTPVGDANNLKFTVSYQPLYEGM